MNTVLLVGRVRQSVSYTGRKNQLVCEMLVVTNRGEHIDWHKIVLFDKAAEIALLLKENDPVFIEGRLQSRREGAQMHSEVVAWTIYPLKGRAETLST